MCKNCIRTPTRTINFPDPYPEIGTLVEPWPTIPPLSPDVEWLITQEGYFKALDEVLRSLGIPAALVGEKT